jgi:ketosteroid isomerase-like protein
VKADADTESVVRGICEVVEAGDWERLGEYMADDGVFHGTIGGIDEGLVSNGPQAVIDYFNDAAAVWEMWRFEAEEVHYVGDKVVVFWRETTRTRHSEVEMVNKTATVFRIRDGKIVEGQGYLDQARALEAAGL